MCEFWPQNPWRGWLPCPAAVAVAPRWVLHTLREDRRSARRTRGSQGWRGYSWGSSLVTSPRRWLGLAWKLSGGFDHGFSCVRADGLVNVRSPAAHSGVFVEGTRGRKPGAERDEIM